MLERLLKEPIGEETALDLILKGIHNLIEEVTL